MSIEVIYRLAIPLLIIGVGIWLKMKKEESATPMKKYWLIYIIIGVLLLLVRIYTEVLY
ncbi:hypothetical protein ACFFU9_10770 [Mariniflexile ostreae]|uniref:Uncharacterized protein n=1 Tax=Mariniflexile ostreae TaxID=1520892 RepID=A0ABV5FCW1_9FLAO